MKIFKNNLHLPSQDISATVIVSGKNLNLRAYQKYLRKTPNE